VAPSAPADTTEGLVESVAVDLSPGGRLRAIAFTAIGVKDYESKAVATLAASRPLPVSEGI